MGIEFPDEDGDILITSCTPPMESRPAKSCCAKKCRTLTWSATTRTIITLVVPPCT